MNAAPGAPWWDGPLTGYDLESSGISTRNDRIVTGYVATFGPAVPGQHRDHRIGAQVLINPGVEIAQGAIDVHGVTNEIAREKGCDPRDGVYAIVKALSDSLKARIPVIGHNVPFDLTMLYWECLRHGVPTVAEMLGFPPAAPVGPIIDTLVLDKQVDKYRPGSRKLDDSGKGPGLATHYGVPLTAAHTADADAIAAVRVAVVIARRHPRIVPADAVELHRAQKAWAFEQRLSLGHHLRKTLDTCWPLCTDETHPTG